MLTLLGKTILVGWEPSGAVLAVVQKLGGAFLWSAPSPPWGRASLGLASRRAPALPLALTRTLTPTLSVPLTNPELVPLQA